MQRWDRSLDLGMDGNNDLEWNLYVSKIYQGGINLCDKPHKLVWVYNKKNGSMTAMLAYHSMVMKGSIDGNVWWTKWLWKGIVPLKIKLFIWLCLKINIITQDVSQRRGFASPRRCIMCKVKVEYVSNIFSKFISSKKYGIY